eukprot:400512-Pyramimonas_sp.AAC.1
MRCEALLAWPANRIHAEMVKIPKEGGPDSYYHQGVGTSEATRVEDVVGASAFSHSITAEVATLLNEHSVTVMIDMWKCFDTVPVAGLISEARAARYPLRLLWQLVTHYAMPRAVKAHERHDRGEAGYSTRMHSRHYAVD